MNRLGVTSSRGARLVALTALAAAPLMALGAGPAGADPVVATFTTAGSTSWAVPAGVSCVTVDAIGAAGGDATIDNSVDAAAASNSSNAGAAAVLTSGGLGGEAVSTIPVLAGHSLDVNVGGRGGDAAVGVGATAGGTGGFNGGAKGGDATGSETAPGPGGGGASDVVQSGNRVVIGGGGGGAGTFGGGPGGAGGGTAGTDGGDGANGSTGGGGGTSSAGGTGGVSGGGGTAVGGNGSLGLGGAGAQDTNLNGGGGGGGGGLFGGGGGGGITPGFGAASGGGGGSGFGNSLTTGVDATNGGNGTVTLTYEVGDTSCLAAPLTIKKVLAGAAGAPGTTYGINLTCSDPTIDDRPFGGTGGGIASADFTFTVDSSGVPEPADGITVGFVDPTDCTVTETGAVAAATASYGCTGAFNENAAVAPASGRWASAAAFPDDPCIANGPQADPIGVAIVTPSQAATVTVTNTLIAAVNIAPRFTG